MRDVTDDRSAFWGLVDDILIILDSGLTIIEANSAAHARLGHNANSLKGRSFEEYCAEPEAISSLHLALSQQGLSDIATSLRSAEGEAFPVQLRAVCGGAETSPLLFLVIHDLTIFNRLERKLEQQKLYDAMLMETVPNAVFTVDHDRNITSWNRFAAQTTGYGMEEVLGKPCSTFSAGACSEHCGMWDENIPKPSFGNTCSIRAKSGRIIKVRKNIDLLRDPEGEIIGGIESFDDLSDRVNLEETLAESDALYAAMVNSAPGIVLILCQGKIVFMNDEGLQALGYQREELMDQPLLNVLDSSSRDSLRRVLRLQDEGMANQEFELEFRTSAGDLRNYLARSTTISYQKKRSTLSVLIDISARKQSELKIQRKDELIGAVSFSIRALLDSRDYLNAVAYALPVIGRALAVDRGYLLLAAKNESNEVCLSLKLEWHSEKTPNRLGDSRLQNMPLELYGSHVGKLLNGRYVILQEEDASLPLSLLLAEVGKFKTSLSIPIFAKKDFWGILGFDTFEHGKTWEHAELAPLATFADSLEKAIDRTRIEEELERSKSQAEAANVMKSQFLATMSHEIRTPMNAIIGFLSLLKDSELKSDEQDWVQEANVAANSLLGIINDILDLSRIEAGKLSLESIPFSLRSLVEQVVKMMSVRASEKNLGLYSHISGELPDDFLGDPSRIRQVLTNLVGNAIKFTERGEVSIHVGKLPPQGERYGIRITVEDTGIGLSEEQQSLLFKPFSQADSSTTRKYGGTGLGLAISRQLVQLMNGEIVVESALGKGSSFILNLFLMSTRPAPAVERNTLDGVHVLVAESDPKQRLGLRSLLEEAGATVTTCASNADLSYLALRKKLSNLDAVLVGAKLTEDEAQFASAIQDLDVSSAIARILVHEGGQRGDARSARGQGFDAYLSYPIQSNLLVACITRAVEGVRGNRPKSELITTYRVQELKDQGRPRILIVEDNDTNRKLLLLMLGKRGFACDIAVDGEEAVAAWKKRKYDLILMDCQMPKLNGYDATRIIRREEAGASRIPIVALTANAMAGDRDRCIEAGMDDYISKPIEFNKLYECVQRYVREEGTGPVAESKEQTPHVKADLSVWKDSVEAFRVASGLDRGDAQELFEEIVLTFPERLKSLDEAFSSEDWTALAQLAHQIKGMSANLRIEKVVQELRKIEDAARTHEAAPVAEALTTLRQIFG